jgi:hypothetical protein
MVLASWITAIATITLAIYAAIQVRLMVGQVRLMRDDLRESTISREASIVLYVLQHMDNIRDGWHALYALPDDHKLWNGEQRRLADHVCV